MTQVQSPTPEQIAASDPAASAWVGANAGSGKTHVLTQRVARLLLAARQRRLHRLHGLERLRLPVLHV